MTKNFMKTLEKSKYTDNNNSYYNDNRDTFKPNDIYDNNDKQFYETLEKSEYNDEIDIIKTVNFLIKEKNVPSLFEAWKTSLWFKPKGFEYTKLYSIEKALIPLYKFEVVVNVNINTTYKIRNNVKGRTFINKPIIEYRTNVYPNLLCFASYPNLPYNDLISELKFSEKDFSTIDNNNVNNNPNFVVKLFDSLFNPVIEEEKIDEKTLKLDINYNWRECFEKYGTGTIRQNETALSTDYIRKKYGFPSSKVNIDISYKNIKKRLIFLPIYICTFVYENQLYYFIVNGRNGEKHSNRPHNPIVQGILDVSQTGVKLIDSLLGNKQL